MTKNGVVGLLVRSDNTGLGNQTLRMAKMIKPDYIFLIDSTPFNGNKQYPERYDGFKGFTVKGFPSVADVNKFYNQTRITHFICCENPHNFAFFSLAHRYKIKTFVVSNYEFCDNLVDSGLPLPYKFVMPSYWHIDTMQNMFPNTPVEYLPPPIDPEEFKGIRQHNKGLSNSPTKLLHIIGKLAFRDRNGTLDLIKAIKLTKTDFVLDIRTQFDLPSDYVVTHPKINYIKKDVYSPADMYRGYKFLVLPRRYGGLSLTTNEALASGLGVLMPDISPNNKLLPRKWLCKTSHSETIYTRTTIDKYHIDIQDLANKIDQAVTESQKNKKHYDTAIKIFDKEFNQNNLVEEYKKVFEI